LWRFQQTKMFSTAQFPNPVIPTNISDATTNLCKSVKSVSFYFSRHGFTLIYTDFTKSRYLKKNWEMGTGTLSLSTVIFS
jgi:hypothetical protein